MEYPKTAQKWDRPEEEIRALVNLVADRSWKVLKEIIEKIVRDYDRTLEISDEFEDILRAQGGKRVFRKLEGEVLDIVDDAMRETNKEKVN